MQERRSVRQMFGGATAAPSSAGSASETVSDGASLSAPRRRVAIGVSLGALLVLTGLACAGGGASTKCKVGAECASGVCHDGSCVPVGAGGGGSGAAGTGGGDGGTTSSSTSSNTTSASGGSGGGALCSPNDDGTIERAEVLIEAGLSAKFLATSNVTFDTTGSVVGGQREWDLTVALAGDHLSLLETQAIPGQWFAADFVGATYAARLSESQALLGVFEVTANALLLRGVVSPQDGIAKTELSYNPPVVVLSFPLTLNKSWSTTSTVSGVASGVAALYTETYNNVVDARGTVVTPFASFDALRVRVVLDQTVGVILTRKRTYAFVTECFGTVATLVSQPNELGTEFSNISEVRRLSN